MPSYKNNFRSPAFVEVTIADEKEAVVGTIRLKPSSVLWKPKGKHSFRSVSLKKFTEWMEDPETKASTTKK